jgi:hypothetical protein
VNLKNIRGFVALKKWVEKRGKNETNPELTITENDKFPN